MIAINSNIFLCAAAALLCFLALPALLLMSRSIRRWRARTLLLESGLAATRRELEMMAAINLNAGRRVKQIEHECVGLADRVELIELRGATRSIDRAIDSARRGADSGRLAQQFGLSRGEAELVLRLHGQRKRA